MKAIRIDGGTQPRKSIDEQVVAEYAEAMRGGAAFPPIIVFNDGAEQWLADGFHRWHAYQVAGMDAVIDVRPGTRRDAVLFSVGANGAHGLRRTNNDKRQCVRTLLADAEWSKWSDRKIADACGVSVPFVGALRSPVVAEKQKAARVAAPVRNPITPITPKGASAPKPEKAKTPQQIEAEQREEEAYGDTDVLGDLEKEIRLLQSEIAAMKAQDAGVEVSKWVRMHDAAQREQSKYMELADLAKKREAFAVRQLQRCGRAVGESDPDKIAPTVEAFVRKFAAKEVA